MSDPLLDLLDRALTGSLWVFLVVYVCCLLIGRSRLRRRRVRALQAEAAAAREDPGPDSTRVFSRAAEWRLALRALFPALLAGSLFLVGYLLLPLPGVQNLVTARDWSFVPLRVTRLQYDRFYEGFSLEGDVWNQSETPLTDLTCHVEILDPEGKVLATVPAAVDPRILEPGSRGRFAMRYTEASPFLAAYRIHFSDAEGRTLAHVEGFDVPR
ncbi:MAG: hypothetical protein Kow00109_15840 [Acidobacteriota bacterium]